MAKKKKPEKEKNKEVALPAEELNEEKNVGSDLSKNEKEETDPPSKPAVQKNCECRKIGRWWYCMKPDDRGHLVLCDGPFKTQEECDELAVCDE